MLRGETGRIAMLRNSDRSVVRIIGSLYLRGHPQPVSTIKSKLGTASFPCIFFHFMKKILGIAKTVEENPRAHISSDNQLNVVIR